MKSIHAIILAGGKGTRLLPYTTSLPKPLMPIGDLPIIEVILKQLYAVGIRNVTLAVGHLAHLIQTFIGNGEKYGLHIDYSFEESPLGTAGPIGLLRKQLENSTENFVTMNGDVLTTLALDQAIKFHCEKNATATICINKREVNVDFGVIDIDFNGNLAGYREKPTISYNVSMGINIFATRVLKYIPDNKFFNIPDLMLALKAADETVCCYQQDAYWLDIGRIDDYALACKIFEGRRLEFLPNA